MGGCTDFRTYDKSMTETRVEESFSSDQETSAYEDGHNYSGCIGAMPCGIDWLTQTFKTRNAAEKYIMENHDKWYEAFGAHTEEGYVVGGWCSS